MIIQIHPDPKVGWSKCHIKVVLEDDSEVAPTADVLRGILAGAAFAVRRVEVISIRGGKR